MESVEGCNILRFWGLWLSLAYLEICVTAKVKYTDALSNLQLVSGQRDLDHAGIQPITCFCPDHSNILVILVFSKAGVHILSIFTVSQINCLLMTGQ